MAKVPEMPIRQEKQLSSEFHMRMLQELETHHDELSVDWSTINPATMVSAAADRIRDYTYGMEPIEQKQLVHAANELMIAWAILESRE